MPGLARLLRPTSTHLPACRGRKSQEESVRLRWPRGRSGGFRKQSERDEVDHGCDDEKIVVSREEGGVLEASAEARAQEVHGERLLRVRGVREALGERDIGQEHR